jgi:hypothetical protein
MGIRRPAIEIRRAGGERATGTCFYVARAVPVFCLRQAAAAKKQENRPLKKNKKNVLYRPAQQAPCPLTSPCVKGA